MHMPQEIEVWYVIPALRKGLAKELKKLKLSQRAIAEKLGITESAVSQYVHQKRGGDAVLAKHLKKAMVESAERIKEGATALDEIYQLCELVKKEKLLCKIHKAHSVVPKSCDVCMKS